MQRKLRPSRRKLPLGRRPSSLLPSWNKRAASRRPFLFCWNRLDDLARADVRDLPDRMPGANCILASFARQRGLTAGGRVVQRKPLKLVFFRRRDRNIAVSQPIRGSERFFEYNVKLTINPQITTDIFEDYHEIALGGQP